MNYDILHGRRMEYVANEIKTKVIIIVTMIMTMI